MKFVNGTVYTYVEVEMFPFHRMTSEKPRTKYIRNEFNPVFDDEVCITISKEEVDDQKMYLNVCDYNQISTRDLIGSCKLDLNEVRFKAKGKPTVYERNLQWIDSVRNSKYDSLERFSNDCRKTKTKAIIPTNHNRSKQHDEPITIPSNYL